LKSFLPRKLQFIREKTGVLCRETFSKFGKREKKGTEEAEKSIAILCKSYYICSIIGWMDISEKSIFKQNAI